RQFWPTVEPTGDPNINWSTVPLTVTESVVDPLDSVASISFSRDLGTYTYKNHPSSDASGIYLNPAVSGAGQYLIKVDQVSGTALTGTLATWIDLFSAATHIWSLDEAVVGELSALANISISQDNGAGSPVAASTVVKSVTFCSEVRDESKISWSTEPYNLVEIKESEDADCILTFNPSGWAVGDADTSGSFTENWHKDAPDPGNSTIIARDGSTIVDYAGLALITSFDAAEYTVNATLVSGTPPEGNGANNVINSADNVINVADNVVTVGSPLGTDLTLDQVRQWTL
ncbi:unnamed protein product, partial [marine sediment metagenome]